MISTILSNWEMIISVVFTIAVLGVFVASFIESWTNSKTYKYAIQGIEFADKVGGDNRTKLVRAVSFVESLILAKVPLPFRGFVDKMINSEKIAEVIERRLTENKLKQLNEKK